MTSLYMLQYLYRMVPPNVMSTLVEKNMNTIVISNINDRIQPLAYLN